MKLLLDTQLILWLTIAPERLSAGAKEIIEDRSNDLSFSAISIWEIVIKRALGRPDFQVEAAAVRDVLLEDDYREVPFTALHAMRVEELPDLHRDPFDRALLGQAAGEGLTLLTADRQLGRYPGAMRV